MNDAFSTTSDHPPPDLDQGPSNAEESSAAAPNDAGSVQQKERAQRDHKAIMLDHLIRNVDIMIYAQLSVLYYMDCSLPKFLLRALPHWFYFTPKPSIFPPPPLTHRPYIGVIFGTNLLCMLLHLIFAPPAAGEATREYLHGGLLIDFVGQASPVGRWRLLGLDLLVLGLQILVLGITLERRGIKTNDGIAVVAVETATETRQDHDSEERGMLRQDDSVEEDIELQDLQHLSNGRTGGDEDRERDELLLPGGGISEPGNQHSLDRFYTGESVIANFYVLDTIRAQWQTSGASAGGSDGSASSGVQAAVVAAAAGRTLTYRLGEGIQRNE